MSRFGRCATGVATALVVVGACRAACAGLPAYSIQLISDTRALADGCEVSLPVKPVSCCFGDHFYIQERSRACGIKVVGIAPAGQGWAVSVRGILGTAYGEREIRASTMGIPIAMQAPRPLGVDAAALERQGLSTVGLLLRTSGKVTRKAESPFPEWFAISRASADLRVRNHAGVEVELEDHVCLTAVRGREASEDGDAPVLKLASAQDFANLTPPPTQLALFGDFECTWQQFSSAFTIEGPPSAVSLDSAVKWRGSKSLKITSTSTSANVFANQDIPLDCTSGPRRVRMSMMCKAQDVVRGTFAWYSVRGIVWLLDGSGKVITGQPGVYDLTKLPTGTFDWHYYERTLVIPRGVARLKLQVGLNGASGTAWFDDIRAVEIFSDWEMPEDGKASVTIDPTIVTSTPSEGIGWNWETVSPERYTASELAIWPDLLSRMTWDGPDWLRIGITTSMCPPAEYARGADTGQHYTYNFGTPQVARLCQLLSFCESRGISVSLANWNAGQADYAGVPHGQWLVKGYYDGTGPTAPDWWTPYSKERMAECLAEFAYYLRVTRGFTCIRYLSVWNEPGGPWAEIGQYPEGFVQIYDLLDTKLKARGIRSLLKLEGLDSTESGDSAQITVDALRTCGSVVDAAAVHDYSYGLEVATRTSSSWYLREWVDDYGPIIRQLNTMRAQPIPLFVTETSGFGTWPVYTPREHFLISLSTAEYAVEMLKAGASGVLRWQYNDPGPTQYEPFTASGTQAVPNRAIYYPWCVLTRWTVRNSEVLSTRVAGGLDAASRRRVHAVALRAPGGQVTVLLTNNGHLPKTVRINLGSAASGAWRHFYYDGSLPDGLREALPPVVTGGVLTATVLPESVNAFTTFTNGLLGAAPR